MYKKSIRRVLGAFAMFTGGRRLQAASIILQLAMVVCTSGALGQAEENIGWSVEFNAPTDLANARINVQDGNSGEIPGSRVQDVRVEDGVMRLGMKFGSEDKAGQNWYVVVEFKGIQNISLKDFPIVEVRYRLPESFERSDLQPWNRLLWDYESYNGQRASAWPQLGDFGRGGAWTVSTFRPAPDSSVPGPLTPKRLTSVAVRIGSPTRGEPVWYDVDYIRLRALTPAEAAAEQERIAMLSNYTPPEIPKRLSDVFFYGAFAAPHSVAGDKVFSGGWEGLLDDLVRAHMNIVSRVEANEDYSTTIGYFRREIEKMVRDRGMYIIPNVTRRLVSNLDSAGTAYIRGKVDELALVVL